MTGCVGCQPLSPLTNCVSLAVIHLMDESDKMKKEATDLKQRHIDVRACVCVCVCVFVCSHSMYVCTCIYMVCGIKCYHLQALIRVWVQIRVY